MCDSITGISYEKLVNLLTDDRAPKLLSGLFITSKIYEKDEDSLFKLYKLAGADCSRLFPTFVIIRNSFFGGDYFRNSIHIRTYDTQLKKSRFADDNFSVSVSKSSNEIVATYKTEETGMDLVIRLPASYPLKPVDVECVGSLGIGEVTQKKWLLSMISFVHNQNGALAEAICIWKKNFDKEFEGVAECPICYSVLHTSNHSMPRLSCKTCKHKFYSVCLNKWFSNSHKSICPLCQSPFKA